MEYTLDSLRQKTDAELAALVKDGLMNDVCDNNDLPTLRYLVDERHLPIDVRFDESLPIIQAALHGAVDVIDFLLGHGADINCLTSDEWYTPLVAAAVKNSPDLVLHLLDLGANPNHGDYADEIVRCMLCYPDVIRRVMECGGNPDICNYSDYTGSTPLDRCAQQKEYMVIDPEEDDEIREMGIRIDKSLSETMQILLDYGACPYLTNAYLHHTELPDTPNGLRMRELIRQARLEERPSVRLYIDILERRCTEKSFLADLKRYEELGADLTAPCPWRGGMELLQQAVEFGNVKAVDYLIHEGCHWKDDVDYIQSACESCSREMVMKLLNAGLQPKKPGRLWLYVYMYGPMLPSMIWLPFEQGWKPEPLTNGLTVLHQLAYSKGYDQAVNLFVAYVETMGIDPEVETPEGLTPRSIAINEDFTELIAYLDNRKADMLSHAHDKQG